MEVGTFSAVSIVNLKVNFRVTLRKICSFDIKKHYFQLNSEDENAMGTSYSKFFGKTIIYGSYTTFPWNYKLHWILLETSVVWLQ